VSDFFTSRLILQLNFLQTTLLTSDRYISLLYRLHTFIYLINQNHARFIEYRANKYMPKHQKISIVSDLYTTEAVMVNSTQVIVEGFESILDLY